MTENSEYRAALCSLKNILGLGCLHIREDEDLLSYTSKIITHLADVLITSGKTELYDNVKIILDLYDSGVESIIAAKTAEVEEGHYKLEDMTTEYGFTPSETDLECFIFVWTHIMTTIYMQEYYNNNELFTTSEIDCHECCGSYSVDEDGNKVYTTTQSTLKSYCSCGG